MAGCYLCADEGEAEWFVQLNNTGGAVDVWAVDGVDEGDLIESPHGHAYLGQPVAAEQVRLVRSDISAPPPV